jgi:zinc protease
MKTLFIYLLLISTASANYLDDNLKKMNWGGIDVVWLEDDSLPTYDVTVYFNEGALGDSKELHGETEMMFSQLSSGTHRYSQKEIVESLEFYGANYGSKITHEYTTFSVSGLVKDFVPVMKMVCHLFDDATFPKKELVKVKSRALAGLKAMVSNHSSLASRAFRYESLKGSGFEMPTSGSMKSIKKLNSKHLASRLKFFNESAVKRIYIKGPKEAKVLKDIILNDCRWKQGKQVRKIPVVASLPLHDKIIFVPVPNSNQAQVRIGRIIKTAEVQRGQEELKSFSANFLGGGFTSRLVQKLRVEKGLTYSAGSYASEQKNYGRSGISTFTKNETIVDLLKSIQEVVEKSSNDAETEPFLLSKKNIKGNYLLGLESTSDFLQNLLHFDHIEKKYEEIYEFSGVMDKVTKKDLEGMIKQLYSWEDQTILILGDKKLVKTLRKAGYKVDVKEYKNYL